MQKKIKNHKINWQVKFIVKANVYTYVKKKKYYKCQYIFNVSQMVFTERKCPYVHQIIHIQYKPKLYFITLTRLPVQLIIYIPKYNQTYQFYFKYQSSLFNRAIILYIPITLKAKSNQFCNFFETDSIFKVLRPLKQESQTKSFTSSKPCRELSLL